MDMNPTLTFEPIRITATSTFLSSLSSLPTHSSSSDVEEDANNHDHHEEADADVGSGKIQIELDAKNEVYVIGFTQYRGVPCNSSSTTTAIAHKSGGV